MSAAVEVPPPGTATTGWSRRRALRRLLWAGAVLVPTSPKLVVLYGLTESEDGVLALLPALLERGHRPVRLVDADGSQHRRPDVSYVRKRSLRGLLTFARAGVVLTSHALYASLPLLPRQRLVLLWHGELVKPVGLLDGDEAVPARWAPVCSELARAFRCAELGVRPDRVPVLGAPRNDRLLSADRAEVRRRLGWDEEGRIWLWLPTYRVAVRGGRRDDSAPTANGLPFDDVALRRLDGLLAAQGATLVLKPHPLSEQEVPTGTAALRLLTQQDLDERGVSLYELLAAADGLVSDVSSVWVDFLLTGRPMVFAFPDLEAYRSRRGLNLEPYEEWLPGPLVDDVDALAAALDRAETGERTAQREQLARRCHRFRDAGSSDRLLDLLGL